MSLNRLSSTQNPTTIYLNEVFLSFEQRQNGVKYFGEKITVMRPVGKLMKGLDQSRVVGRSPTEENLAFTEETLDPYVVSIR